MQKKFTYWDVDELKLGGSWGESEFCSAPRLCRMAP